MKSPRKPKAPEPGYRRFCRPAAPVERTTKKSGHIEISSREVYRHG